MKKAFKIGDSVYHRTMVHFGKGTVKKINQSIFDKKITYIVYFYQIEKKVTCRISDLKTTPNLKKMKRLVDNLKDTEYKSSFIDDDLLKFNKES